MEDAYRFAKLVTQTDFAPRGMSVASVTAAIIYGLEVGLTPMQSLQNVAVINGKPSLFGPAALAVVQRNPDYEWHTSGKTGEPGTDGYAAYFTIKRRGCEEKTTTFSVSDAKKARLWGKQGPWTQYPDRMLYHRAKGFALDDSFPDSLKGMITAEAAIDWPTKGEPVDVDITLEPPDGVADVSNDPPKGNEVEEHRSGATPREDAEKKRIQDAAAAFLGPHAADAEAAAEAEAASDEGSSNRDEDALDTEVLWLANRCKAAGVPYDDVLECDPQDCTRDQVRAAIRKLKARLKPPKKGKNRPS